MKPFEIRQSGGRGIAAPAVVVAGVVLLGPPAAAPAAELPDAVVECLDCHEDPDLVLELGDGTEMSLAVTGEDFAGSVHGGELVCTDCHAGYDEDHPEGGDWETRRDYALASYEVCKECHFDTYTRTLESVHYHLIEQGLSSAPVCTDCHGAHSIQNPHAKQAMVSRSCAECHRSVYRDYAESVHGHALVDEGNDDVPACQDCHEHHRIQDPRTTRFRLSSPGICIDCHGDETLMAKYGISTYVATSYLSDFHGVTASLSERSRRETDQVVVTCVDCHGIHDVASPKELGEETMKATVVAACARCHENAAPDFPAAWLSHYEPSLEHAPLVYLIDRFYRILIPFIVLGLVLHVLLHLYRLSSGR